MNYSSPAEPIQTAVFARLDADAELAALGAAILDDTDEHTPYPYVSIGEGTETPANTHTRHGADSTLTLHVWSSEPGYQQANRIARRIGELLDHQPLVIEGHTVIAVRLLTINRMRDPREEFVRHVAVPFQIVTSQNT